MKSDDSGRREFIKKTAIAGASLLPLQSLGFEDFAQKKIKEVLRDTPSIDFKPDIDIEMFASEEKIQILSGKATKTWRFSGKILKGPTSTLSQESNSFIGPTIRLRRGQKVRIRFKNHLPEKSIIHWHGLHLPEREDAHPSYAIEPKNEFIYEFEIKNRAGTYWYHPHPHGRTGYQIYHGLAGLLIINDEEESGLGLPEREFEKLFVLQDRTFTEDNELSYLPRGRHDRMMGMMGKEICLNGFPRYQTSVAKCPHRIRIVNASNARIYKLGWSDGSPLEIIGTDGGLLERPLIRNYTYLAPGERVDLWKDFSSYQLESEMSLDSVPFVKGGNRGFTVIPFKIADLPKRSNSLPTHLSHIERLNPTQAENYGAPKVFKFSMSRGKGWTIDGLSYEMKKSRNKETVKLGSMEIWEFENTGNMGMVHPVHIHGSQFQVIDRTGDFDEGFIDTGWKDTMLLWIGQRVRVIKRFDDFTGYYPFHCHNLEHGAMGMMRDFRVIE